MIGESLRVAHASRVLVSASRRNRLFKLNDDRQEFRDGEDAIASTQTRALTDPLKGA
jgi:hypothetical protein